MGKLKQIIFIRHGESLGNALKGDEAVYTGGWDCDLTEKGYGQAKELLGNPAFEGVDAIYVSDLKRAMETASTIFPDKKYITDPRIRERSLGEFEGIKIADIKKAPEYSKYFNDPEYMRFRSSFTQKAPSGENYNDVLNRVRPFLQDLMNSEYEKVVVVSHFVAIRCMIKEICGLSEDETLALEVTNCKPIEFKL